MRAERYAYCDEYYKQKRRVECGVLRRGVENLIERAWAGANVNNNTENGDR